MSSRVTDSSSTTDASLHQQKRNKRISKSVHEKEIRKAEKRAEVARLAQARKEKKQESILAKKHNAAIPAFPYCDICQLSSTFKRKHMKLWKCKDCGVHVHDACYGANDRWINQPNPNFRCWACQSVGHSYRVRERDPFSGEHLAVKQEVRPTECCLCSVEDGIHAMHPLYDSHGKKGRQIFLPPEGNKPRRLAWVHTICALTICKTTRNTFGCDANGWYAEDEDDEASFLLDADENSDLDIEELPTGGVHHFVYWGYLNQFFGRPQDEWSKLAFQKKTELRCSMCGKNDKKIITLPGGQKVFVSLRIPIQCTANDEAESDIFKCFHEVGSDPCYVAFHVGCAIWGRNDDGEYHRQRRCWFFPGLEYEGVDDKQRNPVVEAYCPLHALDLFYPEDEDLHKACDMTDRVPGPFMRIDDEAAMTRYKKMKDATAENDGGSAVGSRSGNSVARPPSGAAAHRQSITSPSASSRKNGALSRTKLKRKKPTSSSKKPRAKAVPGLHAVSLHGETTKKRHKVLKKAGEAVQVQTEKHGRLVKPNRSMTAAPHQPRQQSVPLEVSHLYEIQQILNELIERQEECRENGLPFDSRERAILRVQVLKKYPTTTGEFKELWNRAVKYFEEGKFDTLADHEEVDKDNMDEDDVQGLESVQEERNEHQDRSPSPSHPTSTIQGDEAMENSQDCPAPKDQPSSEQIDDPDAELVSKMEREILDAFEAQGIDTENRDAALIATILREAKKSWRGRSGLSKAEYKIVWGKTATKLEEGHCKGWLSITSKSSGENQAKTEQNLEPAESQETTELVDQGDAAHHEEPPAQESQKNDESEVEADGALQDEEFDNIDHGNDELGNTEAADCPREGSDGSDVQDDLTEPVGMNLEDDHHQDELDEVSKQSEYADEILILPRPQELRSNWSNLYYGPDYDGAGFRFDAWDTWEEGARAVAVARNVAYVNDAASSSQEGKEECKQQR